MRSSSLYHHSLALSLFGAVSAVPVNSTISSLQNKNCVQPDIESTWIPFAPYAQDNALVVLFCNPGEPIPPDEAIGALTNAVEDVLGHVEDHMDDPIPGGSFQKSTLFWPHRDRVTVFLHTVNHHRLTWLELARVLTAVEGYMNGAGEGPQQQHYNELAFLVRDNERTLVAVGRIQYVPAQISTATERRT